MNSVVVRTGDAPALPPDAAVSLLAMLDLSMVRLKLADPLEGKGWDDAQLDLAEQEYRRFLALNL